MRYSVDLRDSSGLLVRRLHWSDSFVEAERICQVLRPWQKPGYTVKVKIH